MTMDIANFSLDPSLSIKEATQPDVVRQKLDMDALRTRLGDPATKQEKLRDACEGFEAIFLQKLWEQMRKNVPREGFLHSKDEEAYQSLFDIELCKKMASAGGIGLADMLYRQLSQQLENTGRATTPSSYRMPLDIAPTTTLLPQPESAPYKAEELYTPLPVKEEAPPQTKAEAETGGETLILAALDEIKAELGLEPKEKGLAVKEWAEERRAVTGLNEPGPAAEAQAQSKESPGLGNGDANPALASWQGAGPISATPRPFSPFAGRAGEVDAPARSAEAKKNPRRGMVPDDSLWPLEGGRDAVAARFGWEDDPATGKRRWNSGIRIDAPAGAPVRAMLDGTVVYAGQREGAGNSVVLEHKDGYRSYYGNLMSFDGKIGDKVKRGAKFAKIIENAPSSPEGEKTAFLHFELKKGEMALNPEIAIPRMTTANR